MIRNLLLGVAALGLMSTAAMAAAAAVTGRFTDVRRLLEVQ